MRLAVIFTLFLLCFVVVGVLAIPPPPPTHPALPNICEETNGGVELCDGIDNDCDDIIDEDASGNPLTQITICGVGVCEGNEGEETCVGANDWSGDTCDPLFGAYRVDGVPTEVCGSGVDDDCNGYADEADSACTLLTCYLCDAGQILSESHYNNCPVGWSETEPSSCMVTCYQCDGGSVSSQGFDGSCGFGWSLTEPTSCPVDCYQCDNGQVASAVYADECPVGWSETEPSSCSVTCYQCDAGSVVSYDFVGVCDAGWALSAPDSCDVPLVTCYQCQSGGSGVVLTELHESCDVPWSATVLTQDDCTFDIPVTCYQCDAGQVASGDYLNECPVGWSETEPSSCSVTCYQCDAGSVVSYDFVGVCDVGWALSAPDSCDVPLVTCYQCQEGGTGIVLTDLRESCDAGWNATELTQDDCRIDIACYQCVEGQVASNTFTNECPVGWNETAPNSCSVTCYRCMDGEVESDNFTTICNDTWALSAPDSCDVPLVTCYRCQDGKNGVVLTELQESCSSGWSNSLLASSDCQEESDDSSSSSSYRSSGGGNFFYVPSSDESGDKSEDNDVPITLKTIPLIWSYKDSVASATIGEPTSPVKRLKGNVPEGPFLQNSSLVSGDLDPLLVPLPENFTLYHRFRFVGDVDGVVFEELDVTFTIDNDWLSAQGVSSDDLVMLYPFDGRWRVSPATYNNGSRLYKSSLINVPLQTLAIGVGDYDEEVSVQLGPVEPVIPANETGEPENETPISPSHLPQIISIIVVLLIGGLLIAFFLAPNVPVLGGFHDKVYSAVGGLPGRIKGLFTHESSATVSQTVSRPAAVIVSEPELTPSQQQVQRQQMAAQRAEMQRRKYRELLQRVDSFVARQRSRNVPEQQIIASLRRAGWSDDVIMRHFKR